MGRISTRSASVRPPQHSFDARSARFKELGFFQLFPAPSRSSTITAFASSQKFQERVVAKIECPAAGAAATVEMTRTGKAADKVRQERLSDQRAEGFCA